MKNTRCVIIALAIAIIASSPLFAQDTGIPDTVYYGDNGKAYGYPGGVFRIPFYIATDQYLGTVSVGIEYGLPGGIEPTWDSLSDIGSIFEQGDYLDLGHLLNDDNIDGIPPDTLCIGGFAAHTPLPPGRYKYCDIWFSGGSIGEQVMTDSAWSPPGCTFFLAEFGGDTYVPVFVAGLLTIEEGAPEMSMSNPDTISVDAGDVVSFEIEAFSYYPPVIVQLDSLIKMPDGSLPMNEPQTSGSNPLTFEWTPGPYEGDAVWLAYFTATDALMNSVSAIVQINVLASGSYYGLIGDTNCDGMIDIDDAVFLINYIFSSGPAPACP